MVLAQYEEEYDSLLEDIRYYLTNSKFPYFLNSSSKRTNKLKVISYVLLQGKLYKWGYEGTLL